MDRIEIEGGVPLEGRIPISGAKNAALPIMCAALLTDAELRISNLPDLADIRTLRSVLVKLGVSVEGSVVDGALSLRAANDISTTAPYDMVRKMRASILVLGPLLARFGKAKVSLPGGCAIGTRPIDIHLSGLQALGAHIHLKDGYVYAETADGLKGAAIELAFPSVGATENLMMAAARAKGETIISNAAREPEIADLAAVLVKMGAEIEGADAGEIRIHGADRLGRADHKVMADRIEAGSFAVAAAITRGEVFLEGADADTMGATLRALTSVGCGVECGADGVMISAAQMDCLGLGIETAPYPGFATDMQAQFMALLATCRGSSEIRETIFENRFMHVPELARMGAQIEVSGGHAHIRGVRRLKAAPVMATDLRASVSLVLAGLAAEGRTVVNRVYHLDRGYARIEEKLSTVGAKIYRVKG